MTFLVRKLTETLVTPLTADPCIIVGFARDLQWDINPTGPGEDPGGVSEESSATSKENTTQLLKHSLENDDGFSVERLPFAFSTKFCR